MQRSVRPKSAKGKTRPTPPSRPKPNHESTAISQRQSYGRRGYSLRQSDPRNTTSNTFSRVVSKKSEKASEGPSPTEFPEVSRPVSSLSKYQILPNIPKTPDHGGFRVTSPAESEAELDLLSSFAQQMILDSATANMSNSRVNKAESTNGPSSSKRIAARNVYEKDNNHSQVSMD